MISAAGLLSRGRLSLLLALTGLALAALVPAGAQAATSVSVSISPDGKITAVGDGSANQFTVSDQTDPACPGGSPCYEVNSLVNPVIASTPCLASVPSPGVALCPRAPVNGIAMIGREGQDDLIVSDFVFGPPIPATLDGGGGDDQLQGSNAADSLSGGIDDDTIMGGGGNDDLTGNPGADRLLGAKGRDRLLGGPGKDNLIGGLGNDDLFGSAGNDGLDGAGGRDLCNGGAGRDTPRHCEKQRKIP